MAQLLGFGVGLRPIHYPDFHARQTPPIDWLEIISENFMGIGGRARQHLENIRRDFPIASHGVGLDIAGTDPLDQNYLRLLREHINWLEPVLVTDHLCWTRWRGQHSYDLLPFPLNEESLRHVSTRILYVQEFLGRRLLFENPSSYLDFIDSDIPEPEFLNELCTRTGCGILLDINNCIVNSKNLEWDPLGYIQSINPENVGQFHLAGHSVSEEICIDTHDQPVPQEVWTLYREAVGLFPNTPTLIEWDDKIPELPRLGEELTKARQINLAAIKDKQAAIPRYEAKNYNQNQKQPCLAHQQTALFATLKNWTAMPSGLCIKNALGKQTYGLRAYTNNFYQRYLQTLIDSFPTLYAIAEDEAMAVLVTQYLKINPGEHFSINYLGENLANFLLEYPLNIDFGVPQKIIAELAAFDWAKLALYLKPDDASSALSLHELVSWTGEQWTGTHFRLREEYSLLNLEWNILAVHQQLEAGNTPLPPELATCPILMRRQNQQLIIEDLPMSLRPLLPFIGSPFTLADLVAAGVSDKIDENVAAETAVAALVQAAERHLLHGEGST